MALAVNPKLPVAPPSKLPLPFLRRAVLLHKPRRVGRDNFVSLWSRVVFCPKAVEESKESEAEETNEEAEERSVEETSEIGAEIKKTLAERKKMEKEGEGGGLLSGVAEEIGEIEWPAFRKVLGTTGVVLGVIAGSSVVLLTVNAVLAELSDRVFAGRGVQDFFS